MGAHSVTGTGQGSAEGGLRAFNSMDWFRKVFGIDATQIADGTISNIQWNYLHGLDSNVQEQIDEISGAVAPNHVIIVDPNGAFQSIAAACDSITTSSETNRYVVKVSPGIYEEPLITIPSYVFVVSEQIDAVVVRPDGNHHAFQLSNRSGIANLTISNVPSGYAGVCSHDVGNFSLLHKVSLKDCDIGVLHESDAEDSYLFLEYVDLTDCNTVIKVKNLGAKEAHLSSENLYFEYSSSNSANAVIVDGNNATFFGSVSNCVGADTTGNAFLVTNGAKLLLNSSRIVLFNRGVYADTNGANPYIKLSDIGFGQDNPNNINIEIANTTATGYLQGYSERDKTIINKSNSFFVADKDERTIIVAKKGGDYDSIKDAVDSITDSSYDNRYNVYVGPGVYYEDTITCKNYVSITGDETRSTVIELNDGNTNLFEIADDVNCTLRKLLLRPNPAGGAAVKYCGGVVRLNQIRFGTSDDPSLAIAVDAREATGDENSLNIADCSTARVCNLPILFKFSDDGVHELNVTVSDFISNDTSSGIRAAAEVGIVTGGARGILTEAQFIGCTFAGDGSGCGFKVGDGADLHLMGCTVEDFDIGVHIANEGDGPELEAVGTLIYDNATWDLWVEHPGAEGSVQVTSSLSKTSIDENANISIMIQDDETGGLVLSGDFYQGANFGDITKMTDAMTKGPELGISYGGTMTVDGLTVTVAAGGGYLHHIEAGEPHVQFVEWDETEIAIPANSNYNIYVDMTGVVQKQTAVVDFFSTIFIGRAVSNADSIVMLVDTYRDAVASGTKYDRLFRLYLGPIYRSGSVVTATNRTLHVTQGDYAFTTTTFQPKAVTAPDTMTFATWYRNPTGGEGGASYFTITEGVTNVPNDKYDDGTGTLHTLTDTFWVKHALYTWGSGVNTKFFLVYGQEEFASKEAAIAGGLPTTPGPLTISAVCIAAIVIQKGASAIAADQIIDQRPTLVTRTNTVTSTTVHGNLTGLEADDHTQYLLASGSRALAGNLDMGTHNVTNVGTVDGVDISGHAARHLPNGADALTTDAPNANLSAVSTNEVGVQNKFARSDHWHAIDAYSDGTAGGLVKLDGSGNFTANEITADLVGNVTGDLTGNVTGNVTGDLTGNVTGDVTGDLTGNVTGNCSGTAANITGIAAIANGGTNSSTALNNNRVMVSNSGSIAEAAAITANRALASSASGIPVASATTATELGYVSGVTSAIQTQLNGKEATITGAATTITSSDLTASRALASDGSGKVAVSAVTATELGYVSGTTSAIQTQLNGKQATITGAATTITSSNLTASRALASDGSGKVAVSTATATELGYLSGVTSGIQSQINALAGGTTLNLPYGSFSSSTNQTIADATTAYNVAFNTDDIKYGVTHSTTVNNSQIQIDSAGTYLITVSAVAVTSVTNKRIELWLAVNGNNVDNSNTIVRINSTNTDTTLAVTFVYTFTAGQYFQLKYCGDTQASFKATAAQVNPTRPACPAVICTVNKISTGA